MRWDWSRFKGSATCLKWARRDLEALTAALRYVPRKRACIQAGGNLGIFPKRLAQDFELVYTFEPDAALFARLEHNAPERNIFAIRAALGDTNDPVRMECKRRDDSGRPVHEGLTYVAGPGQIPCFRIDDFKLSVCDLIYLDIEGYEYRAIVGAQTTIERCRPVIAVEINRNLSYTGRSGDELRALIKSHGYRHCLTLHSDEIYSPI